MLVPPFLVERQAVPHSMVTRRRSLVVFALLVAIASCRPAERPAEAPEEAPTRSPLLSDVATVQEHWQSETMPEEDLDSIAVTPDGRLVVTAKATDRLWTFDAATGETGPSFGGPGVERGLFRRPNGVLRVDDLVLVVERDNRRIQALALPALESLGTFGENALRRPYGITGFPTPGEENRWELYVTDQYETPDGGVPPLGELGERIKHFRLSIVDGELDAEWVRSFGETEGPGVLHKVETLLADPSSSRVVVADELTEAMALRIYEDWGDFHSNVATDLFEGEPEGMALYACEDGGGYWIVTDQFDTDSLFHILDRGSFELLGTFAGPGTAHTDGVALTQRRLDGMPAGAFFAVDDDRRVSAFSWSEIANVLELRSDCTDH